MRKKNNLDLKNNLGKYLIIGYGKFGKGFATRLIKEGIKESKILIVDKDPNVLKSATSQFTNVIVSRVTDFDSINDFDINEIETIVIAMSDFEESLMIASNCIKYNAKRYYAKAKNEVHSKLLKTLGVDEVVVPEQEIGYKLAYKSLFKTDVEINNINPHFNTVQIKILNSDIIGKTIRDANLRNEFNCNIFGIIRDTNFIFPNANTIFHENDLVSFICEKEDTEKIINYLTKKD